MILSGLSLTRPLSFGYGVEVWLGSIGGHTVVVRRWSGPALEADSLIVPDAAALFRLNHPGIQKLLWSGVDPDGSLLHVSDWIEGVSLKTFAATPGSSPPGPTDLDRLLRDGLAALEYLHRDCPVAPLVHGDISPANLIVGGTPECRSLTMVDLRGLVSGSFSSGQPGVILGTLPYIPDEVLKGAPMTPPADIWSLAMSLASAFGAAMPWKTAATPNEVLHLRRDWQVGDLSELSHAAGNTTRRLLADMLAEKAADRPTATEALGRVDA